MKKIIFTLLALSMPLFINAQSSGIFSKKTIKMQQELSAYMAGAVPEVDGKVVFATTIAAPGKSKADLYSAVAAWANLRYTKEQARGEWTDKDFFKNTEFAAVVNADKNEGVITARGAEEMIFSNKALAKDYTYVYYVLNLRVVDNSIEFTLKNISYVYAGGSESPERVYAEDWITDKETIKKNGKFHRINGKFRVKTIDLKDELIRELTEVAK